MPDHLLQTLVHGGLDLGNLLFRYVVGEGRLVVELGGDASGAGGDDADVLEVAARAGDDGAALFEGYAAIPHLAVFHLGVAVPVYENIDAWHFAAQLVGGDVALAGDAEVSHRYDAVDVLLLQQGNHAFRGLHRVRDLGVAHVARHGRHGGLRGEESEESDPDAVPLQDQVFVQYALAGVFVNQIGTYDREIQLFDPFQEDVQAVIEFMVPGDAQVVSDRVHDLDGTHALGHGTVRVPLEEVPRINDECGPGLRVLLFQRRDGGEPRAPLFLEEAVGVVRVDDGERLRMPVPVGLDHGDSRTGDEDKDECQNQDLLPDHHV